MVKSVGKRFLSIALVIVMVLTLLPVIQMSANAANVNTGVNGLSATTANSNYWIYSGNKITGSMTAKVGGTCTKTYSAQSSSLTFTNTSGATAQLTFDYALIISDGSIKIDGDVVTSAGTFTKTLENNGTVVIELTSNAADTRYARVAISNMKLTAEKNVTLTFLPGENGSYTVDGETVGTQLQKNIQTTTSVALSVSPASGYKLAGWHNETADAYFSVDPSITASFTESQTIKPVFVKNTDPVYLVGTKLFTDLAAANTEAASGNQKTIIMVSGGTLKAGNYMISSGVTFLIPYSNSFWLLTDENLDDHVVTTTTTSVYQTLTMGNGAIITVAGSISIASTVQLNSAKGQGGPCGQIQMAAGSEITVNSGGILYAFGFIKGNGKVHLNSGAKVYEDMFFTDYPGSATTTGTIVNAGAFPMMKFTARNVEVPMTISNGASESVHVNIWGSNAGYYKMWIELVSNGSGAMFQNSGSVTKSYKDSRQYLDVDGDLSINSMSLNLAGTSASTRDLSGVPIPSNYTINVNSGTTTCNENVIFTEGSQVTIAQGAKLYIKNSENVYVFDGEDDFQSTTTDAVLDINGEIEAVGGFFTSNSKAQVTSSGKTGVVKLVSAAPGATSIKEKNGSSTGDVQVCPASLLNGDGTYTETEGSAAGTVFSYCATHDKWEQGQIYTITFDANGGEGTMDTQRTCADGPVALNVNTFTRDGYIFDGWKDGSGTAYTDQQEVTFTADTTLYAQWKELPKTYTVTWTDENGGVLETDENVAEGTAPVYNGAIPTKDETADSYYVFSGWDKALDPVSENVTYTAKFDKNPLKYHINVYYNIAGEQAAETTFSTDFRYDKSVRLGAEEKYTKDGQTYFFSHWDVNGEQFAAQQITLRPGVGGVTLTAQAVFVADESQAMSKDPLLKVIVEKSETIGKDTALEAHKLVFTLTQSVPGGTAEAVGFVVGYEPNPVLNGDNVFVATSDLHKATSAFTTRVNVTGSEDQTVYVRAYLTYKDGETSKTIYSDSKPYTFPIPNS